MRIDQVIPSLALRDAIGMHTLALSDALRREGFDSDIYYGDAGPDVAHRGKPVSDLGRFRRNRFLLYQASIGSPIFDLVLERSEPKLVNYHNITPMHLIESWEPSVGYVLGLGRAQLALLAPETHLAVADSQFNKGELLELGYRRTKVVSLLIDMTSTGADPDRGVTERLLEQKEQGGADLLFVGKVSPHKAPHDLVTMLALYRRLFDPLARLHLVGGSLSPRYEAALRSYVHCLGLGEAVNLTGSVGEGALESYYQHADVFVCASDHEGFCVPLIEAMGHGMPVVGYATTAVPETVGEAGLILWDKSPLPFALAVHEVMSVPELRQRLGAAGPRRAGQFDLERARRKMVRSLRQAAAA